MFRISQWLACSNSHSSRFSTPELLWTTLRKSWLWSTSMSGWHTDSNNHLLHLWRHESLLQCEFLSYFRELVLFFPSLPFQNSVVFLLIFGEKVLRHESVGLGPPPFFIVSKFSHLLLIFGERSSIMQQHLFWGIPDSISLGTIHASRPAVPWIPAQSQHQLLWIHPHHPWPLAITVLGPIGPKVALRIRPIRISNAAFDQLTHLTLTARIWVERDRATLLIAPFSIILM